jgi:NADH dehydrogenase
VGVEQLLYISGAGAAANATSHWFHAKWRAEQAVRGSGLDWTIIRPTWIYGPDDVSLNRFLGFARRLPFVPMPSLGRQQLAPVFIDDVSRLAADALTDPVATRRVFEIGGPETMSMRGVVERALHAADIQKPILPGPSKLIKLGVAPLALLPNPPMTPSAIDFVNQPATVDIGPLLDRMPRRLTPLDEGLATYLAPGSGPGHLRIETVSQEDGRIDAVDSANA